MILDAPYTSIVDVAAQAYPFLPVRALLADRYETTKLHRPGAGAALILHGERDSVIPVAMGREVFRLANEPKRLVIFPNGDHSDLYIDGNGALDACAIVDATAPQPADRPARPSKLNQPSQDRRAYAGPAEAATTAAKPPPVRGGPPPPPRPGPPGRPPGLARRLHRRLAGQQTLALRLLARQLAGAAHGLGLLAHALLGGLLVVVPELHLAEDALALHLLLERLEGLIDIVIANLNQQAVYLGSVVPVAYASGAGLGHE